MTVRIDGTNSTANPAITGADTDTGLQLGTDEIQFVTGGTNRVTVESGGGLTIEDGDLIIGTAGHGIDFSATGGPTNGTGSSELLDDYEEGTFTPFFTSSAATDPNASIVSDYNFQSGWYTKIGNLVNVQLYMQTDSVSWSYVNGGANNTAQVPQLLKIGGLPFTVKNSDHHYPAANCGYFATWTGWSTGYTPMGYGDKNTSLIQMVFADANGVANLITDYIAILGSQVIYSMTYETA